MSFVISVVDKIIVLMEQIEINRIRSLVMSLFSNIPQMSQTSHEYIASNDTII
jgi:hypothetical protein